MGKLNVNGTEIQVYKIEENDYISLSDMVRNIENGSSLIEKWLRNKNTIEFLGIWEEIYNEAFDTKPSMSCIVISLTNQKGGVKHGTLVIMRSFA